MRLHRSLRVGTFLVAGSAMFVLSGQNAQADTIYACVTKSSGVMRIVTDTTICDSRKETPLSWNTVGPQGPQGETGPPGPGPLKVVDANGVFVGWHYLEHQVVRLVGADNDAVRFTIANDGSTISWSNGFGYAYESSDCSGQGYGGIDTSLVRSAYANSTTIYYSQRTGTWRTLRSAQQAYPDGTLQPCVPILVNAEVAPYLEATRPSFVTPLKFTQ